MSDLEHIDELREKVTWTGLVIDRLVSRPCLHDHRTSKKFFRFRAGQLNRHAVIIYPSNEAAFFQQML